MPAHCPNCLKDSASLRILSCLHVFCDGCVDEFVKSSVLDPREKRSPTENKQERVIIFCPDCKQETLVDEEGSSALPIDPFSQDRNLTDGNAANFQQRCSSCNLNQEAISKCLDCNMYLCSNCYAFHQYMRCFEGHKVLSIEAFADDGVTVETLEYYPLCKEHPPLEIRFFCNSCRAPACTSCLASRHTGSTHLTVRMRDAEAGCRDELRKLCDETLRHHTACTRAINRLKTASTELQARRDHARVSVGTAYLAYVEELGKRRDEMLSQLRAVHSSQDLKVLETSYLMECAKDRIQRAVDFTQKLLGLSDPLEVLNLYQLVKRQLHLLLDINVRPQVLDMDITFENDFNSFAEALKVTYGRIVTSLPLAPPAVDGLLTPSATPVDAAPPPGFFPSSPAVDQAAGFTARGAVGAQFAGMPSPRLAAGQALKDYQAMAIFNRQKSAFPGYCDDGGYPAISTGLDGACFQGSGNFSSRSVQKVASLPPSVMDLHAGMAIHDLPDQLSPLSPVESLSRMQVRLKFGQLGDEEGQFHSPHGFCLGFEEEILVADTNNHRIQVFDQGGNFKFMFGVVGKEDGQLWFPRKVAVLPQSGEMVICDRGNSRSRMQLFSANGTFLKKFSISYMDIVAAVAINRRKNIVIVDSVNPALYEISPEGVLQTWFTCRDTMREPSDLAVYRDQYYVCDFKANCLVVYNEAGVCLRRVGNELLIPFPNGVDVSVGGELLVGSSHGNRFRVTVFSNDGTLIGRYECPHLKISRCCGLKITNDGYIVTLAKNNHHVLMLNTIYVL